MAYTGSLFGTAKKPEPQHQQADIEKLVKIQADQLRSAYATDCLDVKQIQQVLNIGESNAYDWVKTCPAVMYTQKSTGIYSDRLHQWKAEIAALRTQVKTG